MSEHPPRAKRPYYGLDAPWVVRNLAIGGAAALVLAAAAFSLGWAPLARMATVAAIGWLFIAGWMVWGSKVEKVRERDQLLAVPAVVFGEPSVWIKKMLPFITHHECSTRLSRSPLC
jgi:hypothetical protein